MGLFIGTFDEFWPLQISDACGPTSELNDLL